MRNAATVDNRCEALTAEFAVTGDNMSLNTSVAFY
jgi:hypothetical protein